MYFITGTAYAGKSTTVKMLSERYGMVFCGENYHSRVSDTVAEPDKQPNISYLKTLTDWRDFVTRTPETLPSREALICAIDLRLSRNALRILRRMMNVTTRSGGTHAKTMSVRKMLMLARYMNETTIVIDEMIMFSGPWCASSLTS